jgi:hypothetical protein
VICGNQQPPASVLCLGISDKAQWLLKHSQINQLPPQHLPQQILQVCGRLTLLMTPQQSKQLADPHFFRICSTGGCVHVVERHVSNIQQLAVSSTTQLAEDELEITGGQQVLETT